MPGTIKHYYTIKKLQFNFISLKSVGIFQAVRLKYVTEMYYGT